MPWGGGSTPDWGPKVQVKNQEDFAVAVKQTYGSPSGKRLWGGQVTVFFKDQPLFDIEGNLLEGRDGDPWFSWAQRQYESQGETKYKAVVWCYEKALSACAAEAVRMELGDSSVEAEVYDPPVPDEDGPPI